MSLLFASSSICVWLFTCNSCLQLIPCLCHLLLVHQYKVHETSISAIRHFHKKCSNYQRIFRTCWWDALHLPGLPPRLARLLSMSVLLTHKVNRWELNFLKIHTYIHSFRLVQSRFALRLWIWNVSKFRTCTNKYYVLYSYLHIRHSQSLDYISPSYLRTNKATYIVK